jgi:opacity protein-like surface antigen
MKRLLLAVVLAVALLGLAAAPALAATPNGRP